MHPQPPLSAEPARGIERLAAACEHGQSDTDSATGVLASDEQYWRLPASTPTARRDYTTTAELQQQQQQQPIITNTGTLATDLPDYSSTTTLNLRHN